MKKIKGVSKKKKELVYERDQNKCQKCGSVVDLTIDHIIPRLQGGSNELDNLQLLCRQCNAIKASTPQLTFWEKIKYIWNIHKDFSSLDARTRAVQGTFIRQNIQLKKDNQALQGKILQLKKDNTEINKKLSEQGEAILFIYKKLLT